MKKTIFLIFSILIFNFNSQKLNALFSGSDSDDYELNSFLGMSDLEDPSVEYASIYSENLEHIIRKYPQISCEIARLAFQRREAVSAGDLETIKIIDEEVSSLNKLIIYNFKESFILFFKSIYYFFKKAIL